MVKQKKRGENISKNFINFLKTIIIGCFQNRYFFHVTLTQYLLEKNVLCHIRH